MHNVAKLCLGWDMRNEKYIISSESPCAGDWIMAGGVGGGGSGYRLGACMGGCFFLRTGAIPFWSWTAPMCSASFLCNAGLDDQVYYCGRGGRREEVGEIDACHWGGSKWRESWIGDMGGGSTGKGRRGLNGDWRACQ